MILPIGKKLEFTTVANDLNDGNGYMPEIMTFWPMHSGQTPEGVKNIEKMSIAIMDGTKFISIDMVSDRSTLGYGTNINDGDIYLYMGATLEIGLVIFRPSGLAQGLSCVTAWFSRKYNRLTVPPINGS